ncbi:MAG: hydantoinase/oxoprolinase family protein [Bacillota bacterium]
MALRVAVDIGGTFTDLVCLDETTGEVREEKAHTTPGDFSQGVLDALRKARVSMPYVEYFTHGTTVVINAITERKGARTALVTTRGFRDVIEITRANRPDIYNLRYQKPEPFVPRRLRFEVSERCNVRGEVLVPLAEDEVRHIAARCRDMGVEAVAVCFLHSWANPAHEKRCGEILRQELPGVSITLSCELISEWREYERTSTTVLNAYVQPAAVRYLGSLSRELREMGMQGEPYAMQSNGGTATFTRAAETPINLVESGPVAGAMGAAALGEVVGQPNLITMDVGGTTAKTTLIHRGRVRVTTEYRVAWNPYVAGYPVKVPVVDIVEIGAGGGSIAWVDSVGTLHVGPQSAGADPGPACYGRGGQEPTLTDANVVAGRIDPGRFLGGEFPLDGDRARTALEKIARHFSITVEEAAVAVIRLANASMVNALKLVSVRRGYDPRDFTMVAVGGCGPVHAVALARELQCRRVLIPNMPATFSAWGMLMTDLRQDFIRTRVMDLQTCSLAELEELYTDLEGEARRVLARQGVPPERMVFHRLADVRYAGQEHTVSTPVPGRVLDEVARRSIRADFDRLHERHYTFKIEEAPAQIVNVHLAAFGMVRKAELKPLSGDSREGVPAGRRMVDFDELGRHQATVYDRASLVPGQHIPGPAVVEEVASVSVVYPGQALRVDPYGNLIIELEV